MSRYDSSCGGEEEGMTDMQFKTYLLEQLQHWERVCEMAKAADDKASVEAILAEAEKQVEKLKTALTF